MHFVIIGGVAAGASAAARARRLSESAVITLIERGPDVSFANCGLPYFIGGEIKHRDALAVQTPQTLKAMLALDVRPNIEAVQHDVDMQAELGLLKRRIDVSKYVDLSLVDEAAKRHR